MPETTTKITDYDSDPTQFYTEVKTIDGTVVLVPFIRQSERRAFKTCQYQWDWAWNQGFTPALPKQDARWFGTGLHLALAEGGPTAQAALNERLLRNYFVDAQNPADHALLRESAIAAGLDPARVDQVLSTDEFDDDVEADVARARAYGATGVPFFVVDQRYGIAGAQPTEAFSRTLEAAWNDRG